MGLVRLGRWPGGLGGGVVMEMAGWRLRLGQGRPWQHQGQEKGQGRVSQSRPQQTIYRDEEQGMRKRKDRNATAAR